MLIPMSFLSILITFLFLFILAFSKVRLEAYPWVRSAQREQSIKESIEAA